ncbi:hypothetical protein J3458_019178 [Metarhizium acridum]|uniref:uncharacterized protein n=1 Tax=Metarhizium acridum TaxID=92637 RepID=UPI001C6B3324|nr:hypothetical protein J3458_019178 [Metarhizium acridum]
MGLVDAHHAILNPFEHPRRALGVFPIRNKGLVLVVFDDAEPRQHPGELEVAIRLHDDDPVAAFRRQSAGNQASDVVSGKGGAYNDDGAVSLVRRRASQELCAATHRGPVEDIPRLLAQHGEHVAREAGV